MIHLSNNYISSSVHKDLVASLAKVVTPQAVIVPIRESKHEGVNQLVVPEVSVHYVKYSNRIIRFFPLSKIIYVSLCCIFSFYKAYLREGSRVPVVIAHNFWSDGMLAFIYSFFFKIKYSLVVRNTDINIFLPKLPHYRWLIKRVVIRSEALIFISRSHMLRFQKRWPEIFGAARRVAVIPNAVSEFWLQHLLCGNVARNKSACFVGRFNSNKNIANIVRAAEIVHANDPEFRLVMVGGESSEFLDVSGLKSVPKFVDLKGHLTKESLKQVYRDSRVFIMPSFTETFGLVYIEALSQGNSVICSAGEGIDGMWDEPFIQSVDPRNVPDIAHALVFLMESFPKGIPCRWIHSEIPMLSWSNVALKYKELSE